MSFRSDRIGVVGAGPSAWWTALALKAWRPEIEVTVVGDDAEDHPFGDVVVARPTLLPFLHGYLGLDPHALARAVAPTWTLGLRLAPGRPDARGDAALPFGEGDLAEAWAHDGGLWRASLAAMLLAGGRAPVLRLAGEVRSLLPQTPLGYHLDRERLVAYLAQRGATAGVRRDPRPLRAVRCDGDRVASLVVDGDELRFGLYVDASGVRARLLEALAVPFVDAHAPFNAAVTGTTANGGAPGLSARVQPLRDGVLLTTPARDADHHLYLHAGDASAAEAALRAAVPGLATVRHAPVALGRRRDVVHGNVVAVGASYGLADPVLQAAAHFDLLHVSQLLALLQAGDADTARSNARVAERWDSARDLAALHHHLNAHEDSSFWTSSRDATKLGRLAGVIDEVRAGGLLSRREGPPPFADPLVGAHGLDALLLAAGVRPERLAPRVSATEWETLAAMRERAVEAALPLDEALAAAGADRALLDDLVFGAESWCAPLAAQLQRAVPAHGRSRTALAAWAAEMGVPARFPSDFARTAPRYPESPDIDFGKFQRRIPDVVLRPRTQDELAQCMTTLVARGVPFKTRGTGHSNGGQTLIEDGAVIDLRGLDRVIADDPTGETLSVEGGCLMEAAQTHLYRAGQGRWLTNLLMHWRVTMAGSLAVGGFGDTSHLRGTQLMMVERLTLMTPDGTRHRVGPGDPLFDYSLGGRGQLGVMTEITLKTERRPGRVVARVVHWPSMRAFLADAATIIGERRFSILRGRIIWQPATVDGAVGNFQDAPRGDEDRLMRGLAGRPSAKLEDIDYYTENMKPPSDHWLPATPAVEFALPFDPADMPAAVALMDELRARVLGAGLGPYTPLGTSFMVLPTVDTLPLSPVPKQTPFAIMIALRPEMPPDKAALALPAMRDIGAWALSRGGKLYLMCVEPGTPDFLERQFGEHLAPLRALKRLHDPHGLLNPGLLG